MNGVKHDHHGSRYSCRLLADLIGCNPRAIGFDYCHAVPMWHWAIECNHGRHDGIAELVRSDKWHDVGRIDPIKSILIANE